MRLITVSSVVSATIALLILCDPLAAQIVARRIRTAPGAGGVVNLPYMSADSQGDQWMVYQPGVLQMQGNVPVYSQAGQLMINGMQPGMSSNQGRIDEKTGELILDNMNVNGFNVTRRLLFNADENYVRYIDIIHNTQGQDQQVNVQITSNVNFGVRSATMVADPKKKDQNIGWVAQINGPGRAAVELFAGRNSKNAPTLTWPQGNNFVQANLVVTVPANKEIAFVHFHAVAATQDQGVQWINKLNDQKLLADVPPEIRKEIVNFPPRTTLIGDLEVLRGDILDAVELQSGDRLNGTLNETAYRLDTSYGTIDLPVDKIVGILNVGRFRPRQLLVTADGQIFGGYLEKQTIGLELSSGQKTQIPLAQVSRVGYRRRADENPDAAADQLLQPPYLLLSSGDRIGIAMPTAPIGVVTRYGSVQVSPDSLFSIAFASEDSGVHTVFLSDGSRFSGLVNAAELEVKLSIPGKDQTVKFPIGSINRLVIKNPPDDMPDSLPLLKLKEDQLVGTLGGQLKLDTAFDTITLNAAEIRGLSHVKDDAPDVAVTTWDGTVFSGQLEQPQVSCHLVSGLDLSIPVDLLQSYSNSQAQAPELMLQQIKAIVADLNADDWKQRDAAQQQLIRIGPPVIGTLKSLRDQQPPEAQQRIDTVLQQLEKVKSDAPTGERDGR